MKKYVTIALRILIGSSFLFLGLTHFYYTSEMAIYVPLPKGSVAFVYLCGLLITLASVAVLFNQWVISSLIVIGCVLAFSGGFVQLGIESRNIDEILKPVSVINIFKLLLACILFLGVIWRIRRKN